VPARPLQKEAKIAGETLDYWIAQAASKEKTTDLDDVVAALAQALQLHDHSTKVAAADALAALGADAWPAVPALIDQLGHEVPFVRASAMGAIASVGKVAVPELIKTFQAQLGGPSIRSAFVLAAIGTDAKEAVPALAAALESETPAMQVRLEGILSQIDPENYAKDKTTLNLDPSRVNLDEISELAPSTSVEDWPQFHGPRRDSRSLEHGLLQQWPEGGPPLLWVVEGLGRGFSTVSISNARIFTMGDRAVEDDKEAQFVMAYALLSREELWAVEVGEPFLTGPRSTPTVEGNHVYAMGTEGDLVCLEAASGEVRWKRNLVADFGGKMMSGWKYAESPLVDGERVICTPGGDDAMIVALNKDTGKLIWKSTVSELGDRGADGAGYSSAVVAELAGVRQYVQMIGRGVVGVDAETGKFLWGYNRIASNVANITAPVVQGNFVFVTTAYNTGSALLEIVPDNKGLRAEEVYFLAPRDFQNHHGGVVLVDGHIFGGHRPNSGHPTCIDLATGRVLWTSRSPAMGSGSVLYADDHIIFRYDRGDVVLIEASPDEMRIKGHFMAVTAEGPAWAHPVVHDGKLYLRHDNKLACYDLRARK
jgi:outer membrane protein assembly factor BamB